MSLKDIIKQQEDISRNKIKCKCGHSILLGNQKRRICNWCGKWVYKDKRTEFEYKLKESIINDK